MKLETKRITQVEKLPADWDLPTEEYFQTKEFLKHCHEYNPCRQRYYVMMRDGGFAAGAVVYTLKLDLLTFLRVPSPISMQIIGIPCSVSAPGLLGEHEEISAMTRCLMSREAGFLVGLNLGAPPDAAGIIPGRTLPSVAMNCRFASWEDYRDVLRSDYRRRLDRLVSTWKNAKAETGPCDRFDGRMYKLYLEVYKRSSVKLEKLSLEFFANLPAPFSLTTYHSGRSLLGWHICAAWKNKFYFFMGGMDYQYGSRYNTYYNLLNGVLKEAIRFGAHTLDWGQTAETPKTRMGGRLVEKQMFAYHRSSLFRSLVDKFRDKLEYKGKAAETRVFRGNV